MELCNRIDRLDIMITKCRSIEEDSANWNLTIDQRRSLYAAVGKLLDSKNDKAAFKVSQAYIKLFTKKDMNKDAEASARRCVILALKASDIINFEELLEIESIKCLADSHKEVLDLITGCISTDVKDFKNWVTSKFGSLCEKEGISISQLQKKKSYLLICQLSTEKTTNFKYAEVAALLHVSLINFSNLTIF